MLFSMEWIWWPWKKLLQRFAKDNLTKNTLIAKEKKIILNYLLLSSSGEREDGPVRNIPKKR